jgi:hypothetical protein
MTDCAADAMVAMVAVAAEMRGCGQLLQASAILIEYLQFAIESGGNCWETFASPAE